MTVRRQRTIARPAEVRGFGLFGGVDCCLRFRPAAIGTGIRFHRTDLTGAIPIPATADYVQKVPRRTALADGRSSVETIEHVMAALAGLWIDNCLVELDAPEAPIGDGSAMPFVDALLAAGIVDQNALATELRVSSEMKIVGEGHQSLTARPGHWASVCYSLDYGPGSPVPPQSASVAVTPQAFASEIAFARTFVLASEIEGLQKLGYGRRATTSNLIVFDDGGPRDGALRRADECARHKVLDAIGDLALCGGRPVGQFHAVRSGHHLNQAMAFRLKAQFVSHSVLRAA